MASLHNSQFRDGAIAFASMFVIPAIVIYSKVLRLDSKDQAEQMVDIRYRAVFWERANDFIRAMNESLLDDLVEARKADMAAAAEREQKAGGVYTAYFLIFAYFGFVGVSLGHYVGVLRFQESTFGQPFLDAYLAFCVLGTMAFFTATALFWFWAARFSNNGHERSRRTMNGLLIIFILHDCPFFFLEMMLKISLDKDKQQSTQYEMFVFGMAIAAFGISFIPSWLHFLKHASQCIEAGCREEDEIVSFEKEVFSAAVEEFGVYDIHLGQWVAPPAAMAKVNMLLALIRRQALRNKDPEAAAAADAAGLEIGGGTVDDDGFGTPHRGGGSVTIVTSGGRRRLSPDAYASIVSPPKELLGGSPGGAADDATSHPRWRTAAFTPGADGKQKPEDGDDGSVAYSGSGLWSAEAVLSPPALVVQRLYKKAEGSDSDDDKRVGSDDDGDDDSAGGGSVRATGAGGDDSDADNAEKSNKKKSKKKEKDDNKKKDSKPSSSSSSSRKASRAAAAAKNKKKHDSDSSDGIGGGPPSDDD